MLALVGPSGAGKSTMAKLLLRFYDPDAGRVSIGGTDLRNMTLGDLRDNVAVLLQETLVFDGTVRENAAAGVGATTYCLACAYLFVGYIDMFGVTGQIAITAHSES